MSQWQQSVSKSIAIRKNSQKIKNLTPPTNYRTEIGYVLRCADFIDVITPHIGPTVIFLTVTVGDGHLLLLSSMH